MELLLITLPLLDVILSPSFLGTTSFSAKLFSNTVTMPIIVCLFFAFFGHGRHRRSYDDDLLLGFDVCSPAKNHFRARDLSN